MWSVANPMSTARAGHTSTLLASGKVLVAGGQFYSNSLATAELYDPGSGEWTQTGSMGNARAGHVAVLLSSGLVLVTGGSTTYSYLDKSEFYDPTTGQWTPAAPLNTARTALDAVVLPNGKVLAVGGVNYNSPIYGMVGNAELYDPGNASGINWQPATLGSARTLANGAFQITFSSTTNANFSVLATTFPGLPLSEWMVLSGVTETSPGQFQFTDLQATNFGSRYYRVRSP